MKTILKRNVSLILVGLMAVGMLAGCGMKPDDAKSYVQATLDAGYKANFDEYTKITDSTKEEAQKLFDNNIDTVTNRSDSARWVRRKRRWTSTANCWKRFLQR